MHTRPLPVIERLAAEPAAPAVTPGRGTPTLRELHIGGFPPEAAGSTPDAVSTREHPASNADSLSLDHLRSFLAVVETGSQVRAAKRLGVAQTTICRHLERVQTHFGGSLFESGASGRLSARGLLVEQAARNAVAGLSTTRERLANDRPLLRLGYVAPVRPLIVSALRSQLTGDGREAFDVRLSELGGEAQSRALERRELDIAVSYAIPDLAERKDIDASLLAEEPFALVIPAHAWARGKPSLTAMAPLLHATWPRRLSRQAAEAQATWLEEHGLSPSRTVECERGSEIVAYAGAGCGYGFLPALWSMSAHPGAVFVPVDLGVTAPISAYSLQHASPWVTHLRQQLSVAARRALRSFRTS
ncbi:MAG TPA: LysR family transcriptional regulator [Polyangiaceae bacterium]|nr:LysR family transcriptional regulator [Polyangiaceae bacterium]